MSNPRCRWNVEKMRADCIDFMDRQGISRRAFTHLIGAREGTLFGFLNGARNSVSLDMAASIALVCDVDLNGYIRDVEFADDVADEAAS